MGVLHFGVKVPVKLNFKSKGWLQICISRNSKKEEKTRGDIKWQTDYKTTGAAVQTMRYGKHRSSAAETSCSYEINTCGYFLKES